MTDYTWKPIAPLSQTERTIDLAAMRPLYETWQLSKERLKESSEGSFREFTDRLVRRLSVETGILERLYDLDRGTTEALVAVGFAEELVSRSSTDIEPSRLIDILRDQQAAIQLGMDCVGQRRELTVGMIHELHSILTRHQETTVATDERGNRLEIPLLKGQFKLQPNNPRRPDGDIHEYCPPVQVASEMDNLLAWLSEYGDEDPMITASWLHHRFTQIHPYQDGNGRVIRALTSLLLLKHNLLPLVVDRDLRVEYIQALEQADQGDLSDLASLFARLQRSAIMQALSVDADAEISHERSLTGAVLDTLAAKFDQRRRAKNAELREVNGVASSLRGTTRRALEEAYASLKEHVSGFASPEIHMTEGGPDRDNAHWYKSEVVRSANDAGKYANFEEDHYFIKGTMRVSRDRLVFVTSFHHVGRALSGIMEATAFANLEAFEASEDRDLVPQDFFMCSLDPFVFTYRTDLPEIQQSYDRWLDAAIAVAIKEYGDRL